MLRAAAHSRAWLVVAALLAVAPAVAFQDAQVVTPESQQQADRIASSLMSPYCPGLTLLACPSSQAATLRHEMADRLQRGESRDEVVAGLVARFGSQVTGVPEKEGVGALAWVIPPIAAAGMLGGIYLLGRRRTSREEPADETVATERSAQIDDELDRLDS